MSSVSGAISAHTADISPCIQAIFLIIVFYFVVFTLYGFFFFHFELSLLYNAFCVIPTQAIVLAMCGVIQR